MEGELPSSASASGGPDYLALFLGTDASATAESGSEVLPSPGEEEEETSLTSDAATGELRVVLQEIDQLSSEMRRRPPSDGTATDPPREPSAPPAWDEGPVGAPTLSPYLEERLSIASASMSALGRDIRDLGERWRGLQAAAERLEQEMEHATLESGFLNSAQGVASSTGGGAVTPAAARTGTAAASVTSASSRRDASAPTPYSGFTVARYNSTIGSLKARRRQLAWWTVALATAISAVLVGLTLVAREPMPVIWLAVLPAVWMIPVPFFVISFISTQRVLRRNHLDMSGGP